MSITLVQTIKKFLHEVKKDSVKKYDMYIANLFHF